MSRRLPIGLPGWVALALALATAAQAAEERVLEAVGAVPVVAGERAGSPPRDRAIDAGLREAVTRVAQELLIDVEPPEGADDRDPQDAVADVLGGDVVRYTSRFRILEDRGQQPALFEDRPEATAEYVVVLEVHVDVDRVRSRLVEVGLLDRTDGLERVVVMLDVEGLDAWPAYALLRDTLVSRVGAESVVPRGFERGRARLEVASGLEAPALLERLIRSSPPELDVTPLAAEEGAVHVRVAWTPPPPSVDAGRGSPARRGGAHRGD